MRGVSTRLATPDDTVAAVAVIRRSIIELCQLDHQDDAATLEQWLRNKTPEHFNAWLAKQDNRLLVASVDGAIAGVAALHRSGELRLCYVGPDFGHLGVGTALVQSLEAYARAWGMAELKLQSTATARGFYERLGYLSAGDSIASFGVVRGYPYSKALPR